jgi:hypothetical protein
MSENGNSVSTERGGVGGEVAVLAGGCFWRVEDILRKVPDVLDTEVGYTGGWLENPTYHDTHGSKCRDTLRRTTRTICGRTRAATPVTTCGRSARRLCTRHVACSTMTV